MTDIALDEKALPCPFCNVSLNYIEPNGGEPSAQHPHSDECVLSQFYLWGAEPIAAWNRRASPSQVAPANPAQVTDAMVEVACIEFLRPSPYNVDWSVQTEGYKNVRRSHMRAALTAAIGAGGQAVAEDAETLKARAASVLCEAGALCGWPAPNCNAREGAEALFKAGLLSQPHPADERVVERLREALIKGKAALGDLLRCEYESNGKWGLADFIDNCGQPYQSADLDRCIKAAEETITAIDASLNGGPDHG